MSTLDEDDDDDGNGSQKPVKAALLRSDGTTEIITLSSLESFQDAVGGFIEAIALRDATMYVNEEGKLNGLPVNSNANVIARAFGSRISYDDLIVGDVIIVGPTDDYGCDTDCPQSLIKTIFGKDIDG